MSLRDKIDVLDIIINVLNDHERKLDELVERLEGITNILEKQPEFELPLNEHNPPLETIESSTSVLIVDDDEFLTQTFKVLLEDVGFIVDTANSGNQAILKTDQRNFDLAILDLLLPDIDGKELCKILKNRNKSMNIILLTGRVEALEEIDANSVGSEEVLLKPVSPDELIKITEKLKNRN
jgi:CheY-like chemotaxis protein